MFSVSSEFVRVLLIFGRKFGWEAYASYMNKSTGIIDVGQHGNIPTGTS